MASNTKIILRKKPNKFGEYPKPKTTMQLRREAHQQKIKDVKEKKKTAQLIKKFALEESPVEIVKNPYMKKAITDAEILEKLDKQRGPSMWSQIYDGLSPHEKGSWNAEYRKKGFNGKTGDALEPITKTIPKEVNQIMNIELDNIRQMRMEAEEIRNVPERILEIKKKERAGLHEDFVKEKLLVGSILKGEDEKI